MRKIGELKGKPIIEGNPNEIKKNQIHYKESDGGITLSERKNDNTLSSVTSGSGSGEGVKEYYYKCSINKNDEDSLFTLKNIFYFGLENAVLINTYIGNEGIKVFEVSISTLEKIKNAESQDPYIVGFRYKTKKINDYIVSAGAWGPGSYVSEYNNTITITTLHNLFKEDYGLGEDELSMLDSMFIEITKEEYESMITYKPE